MVFSPPRPKGAPHAATPSAFEAELHAEEAHISADQRDWRRPASAVANCLAEDVLLFQQIEIDFYMQAGTTLADSHATVSVPVVRLFGVTRNGCSILLHVHGFYPYLFVPAPWRDFTATDRLHFATVLEERLQREERGPAAKRAERFVHEVELVHRQSVYGYSPELSQPFLRITLFNPNVVAACKRILENNFEFARTSHNFPTFESNIPYIMRFMVDAAISGMSWVSVPMAALQQAAADTATSRCQIEAHLADWRVLVGHAPDGEFATIARLRVLSFDIECAGRKGVFPDATVDPVIQIASVVTLHGDSKPFIKCVFTLGGCSNIVGAVVRSFAREEDLLMAWSEFVQAVDPDVFIGYNIANFDFPYLLGRAQALRLPAFCFLGRIVSTASRCTNALFSSKAYGTRESKAINLEGCIVFDLLQVFQREYKLRSYSLNAVSAHFLNEQKEDVPHTIITDLQNGSDDTRRRLAVYCLKDAVLPQRLMERLMLFVNYAEMARVTGVPFNFLLARGQQIKVISQMYRKALENGYLIPALKVEAADEQYEGATVIDPAKGYYDVPIATLDFTSLYPSIMMAHNLCYTTLLSPAQAASMNAEEVTRTPSGDYFVRASVRKGILPRILEELLAARKKAKADLKSATDPEMRAVLDGRQLALKISANSVYGFTGATIGKLPCIAISQSVTAYGRAMIEETKRLVEQKFTAANGYPADACVIYGDTDSVMVKFGVETLEPAMQLGREAASYVTSHFVAPINLDFEKVYFPYLLINKKRYAGLYWTNTVSYDKMDMKGIETVRRDNCQLVQTVVDTCLRKILIDRDVAGAKAYAKQIIADLLQNKIDLSQLVITKALSKSGEDYAAKQAHVELAERMRKRDAGSAPGLGDRVAYVIVRASKGAAAYEKSEDPIYVLENGIAIDTKYYLDNQLAKPLMRIFEPIVTNADEILAGDHTRIVHIPTSTSFGAFKGFVSAGFNCLGCKAPLSDSRPVCEHCAGARLQTYQQTLADSNQLEVLFGRLWAQCQRCCGDVHHDILCTSRDCPIFYMRKKVQKDLGEASATLARFATDPSVSW